MSTVTGSTFVVSSVSVSDAFLIVTIFELVIVGPIELESLPPMTLLSIEAIGKLPKAATFGVSSAADVTAAKLQELL